MLEVVIDWELSEDMAGGIKKHFLVHTSLTTRQQYLLPRELSSTFFRLPVEMLNDEEDEKLMHREDWYNRTYHAHINDVSDEYRVCKLVSRDLSTSVFVAWRYFHTHCPFLPWPSHLPTTHGSTWSKSNKEEASLFGEAQRVNQELADILGGHSSLMIPGGSDRLSGKGSAPWFLVATSHPSNSDAAYEVQVKGAGCTPFSRSADGLAILRSSILTSCSISYACVGHPYYPQHTNYGVPRILGEWNVKRILKLDNVSLDAGGAWGKELVFEVARRSAKMVVAWQPCGFMHGVINTDKQVSNVSIAGLTIDHSKDRMHSWICLTPTTYAASPTKKVGMLTTLYACRIFFDALAPLIGARIALGNKALRLRGQCRLRRDECRRVIASNIIGVGPSTGPPLNLMQSSESTTFCGTAAGVRKIILYKTHALLGERRSDSVAGSVAKFSLDAMTTQNTILVNGLSQQKCIKWRPKRRNQLFFSHSIELGGWTK
ncbi:hypothetical protein EDD17DRAFT_1503613 [Pisolithus thermaeus]|nr:hypothetical protein EDD17DRAFT_1503613 [Pisolithus thermaeus]